MPFNPPSPAGPEKCPNCDAPLPERAPQGLCPKCLFARLAAPTEAGELAAPTPTLTPEQLAPHFPQLEILECLGRGGMGVVYKARQKSLGRLVALKLLAPERAHDAGFAERFAREAQALAALNHPHIVTVYDFGVVDAVAPRNGDAAENAPVPHAKMFFLLMEFVDGVNLRQAMKAGRFTPEQALAVVPPVCEALQYAHEHGIVHRDIKPENLLLDKEGRVKIADFGIAKILGAPVPEPTSGDGEPNSPNQSSALHEPTLASVAGTPQYMAPEQKAHRATDHRADIYSLGVVLYELLTGELPADKLQPPSRKVQIDVRLDEIVLRALEKTPELRYQTAGEFRTQVVTMTGGANVPPVEPTVAAAPSRFSRTAIVGACWMFAFPLMAVAWVSIMGEHSNRHAVPWYVFDPGGPLKWWVNLIVLILFPLGITAPFGTTILGWISVTQIGRSAGKLYGLWLAVFDGLLFPLLALDALIIAVDLRGRSHIVGPGLTPGVTMAEQDIPGSVALLLLALIIVVDFLIIRAVWRAANKSSPNASTTAPAAPIAQSSPRWRGWDVWAIAICLTTFGGLWLERLQRAIHEGGRALVPDEASHVMLNSALATLILLTGAAFLWVLAKNIKTPASRVASGKRFLGRMIVPAIAAVVLLRAFVVEAFVVPVNSLAPEIPAGSRILVWKLSSFFAIGDVIAYAHEDKTYVGRVVRSTDTNITINRNGWSDESIPRSRVIGRVISVFWRATPQAEKGATTALPATDDSIPLAQAVNDFNKRHHDDAAAAKQTDLTVEAVLAAIRWAMLDQPKLSVTNETFAKLGRMTETQVLPKGFELELLTGYEPNDKTTFEVWSVRLRIPSAVIPGGTTCIMIHEQQLGSRAIGEEERKVIHAEQEKERAQGGIGSMDEGQKYREERAAAAAIDARNKPAITAPARKP